MKLLFQDQTIEFEPTVPVDDIILKINQLLGDDYYFSHLIVDGEEIKESPEQYLLNYVGSITEVQIIAVEAKVFINDLLLSAEEYIKRATPILEVVAERFYETPTAEEYNDLNDLFGGLQWLTSMISVINESKVRPEKWDDTKEMIESLQDVLNDFAEALENNDTVLIADLLSYEIKPVFEELNEQMTDIIDSEGERYELH